MGFSPADLSAIPVQQLALRRLRLGPFGSGRDLVRFLGIATIGAIVAAVSFAVVWLPFLAIGATVAFVRVEGQTLDEFAIGYCRFRWRSAVGTRQAAGASPLTPRPPRTSSEGPPRSIQAGGIPIAYLPPSELQRLFEEWRTTLATFDRPIGCRMRGERFSPLPFLPRSSPRGGAEAAVLESYREMVRLLLRHRHRRVVDLTVWESPSERRESSTVRERRLDALVAALLRLGIPAGRVSFVRRSSAGAAGSSP
jgi:hypothetical protein